LVQTLFSLVKSSLLDIFLKQIISSKSIRRMRVHARLLSGCG